MAYKTAAENITLLNALLAVRVICRRFLAGAFTLAMNAVTTANEAGDPTNEDDATEQSVASAFGQSDQFYAAVDSLCASVIPHLGRLASASDVNNADVALSAFNDYLTTNSKSVQRQDWAAKFTSMSAGGSNVGTGLVGVLNTDGQSLDMDISHVETLTIKCIQDQSGGSTAGRETFSISGAQGTNRRAYERGGSGPSGQYVGAYGAGVNEWPASILQTPAQMQCAGASVAAGNLLTNGDFETAISGTGTTKLNGWTISSGDSTLVQASTAATDLINGTYSIKTTGNFLMYQLDSTNKMKGGKAYSISTKVRPINGGAGTVTGTLTVKVKSVDDVTTYATHTVTVGSITVNTNGHNALTNFVLPAGVKQLKTVVELASIGGTAATPTVALDDVIISEMQIVDGGRAIAIHDGSNITSSTGMVTGRFKLNDLFTGATTAPTVGEAQRLFNELFARYVKHASSPTDWVDPTVAAEIGITNEGSNIADGGTIALGTVATGAHVVTLVIANTGLLPLAVQIPTSGTDTNITSVTFIPTVPVVVLPGESYTLAVRVTDAGAGAFSTLITIINSDPDAEGTYTITISGTAT